MFSFTLVASIGYGDIAPATDAGRLFCIFFTLIATPVLVVSYLGAARKMMDFFRVSMMLFSARNILTFKKYDVDDSGQLDAPEFAAALRDLGYPVTPSDTNLIMEEVNICDSTQVTIQEFGQALILLEFPAARHEKHRMSAIISSMATLVWLLTGALCFQWIENWSFVESLWFCWETIMTIGLGDLVPQTEAGRWFNLVYSFVGLGHISVLLQSIVDLLSKHGSIIGRLEMRFLEGHHSNESPSFHDMKKQHKHVKKRVSLLQAERSFNMSDTSPSAEEANAKMSNILESSEGSDCWAADPADEQPIPTELGWVSV